MTKWRGVRSFVRSGFCSAAVLVLAIGVGSCGLDAQVGEGSAGNAAEAPQVASATAALSAPPEGNCSVVADSGKQWWFCPSNRSWSSARQKCLGVGLDLAVIESAEENDLVRANIDNESWIGATDAADEDTWIWIASGEQFWDGDDDGDVVPGYYENWGSNDPDGSPSDLDCALMDDNWWGRWTAEECDDHRDYVCSGVEDECPMHPETEAGQCGCGNSETDTDGDGTADCIDECDDDPDKAEAGDCGCGVPDTDTDSDGVADCIDVCDQDPDRTEAPCSPDLDCEYMEFGDSVYFFCDKQREWAEAKANCEAVGMKLARIDDSGEQNFIKQNVTGGDNWIGGSDLGAEGVWMWELGEEQFWQGDDDGYALPGFYENWTGGQPNNAGNEDCLQIESDGDWRDDECDDTEPYVCESGCHNNFFKELPGVCGCDEPDYDDDGDGTLTCLDGCPDDAGKTGPGVCGCGVADDDTDGDGTVDCNDECVDDPAKAAPGECGCGLPDVDSDGDGALDCADCCPSDPNKFADNVCGCGVPDTDTDGDGTPDCVDICGADPDKVSVGDCGCDVPDTDSDGDGTPDCNDECPADSTKTVAGLCGCGGDEGDDDGDGTENCNDECPNDASKALIGMCGCGVAEDDTDDDGYPDCIETCSLDPDKQDPGDCGCADAPIALGTACSDGVCAANNACDGEGECGSYDECAVADGSSVSAGFAHTCSVRPDREVWCWGRNIFGRLGDGTQTASLVPIQVQGLPGQAVQVSSHGYDDGGFSCAVLEDGRVYCWGFGSAGTMGNGTTTGTNTAPQLVTGIDNAVQVSVGENHACAVRRTGVISCWGNNDFGQLGDNSTDESTVPVDVTGVSDAVQVSAGAEHSCAVHQSGALSCWGNRANGRLGLGAPSTGLELVPAQVVGSGAVQVSAGLAHTCTLLSVGAVQCWGANGSGQLGDGTVAERDTPAGVSGLGPAEHVSAGSEHSCAVLATGDVACWGNQDNGRIGNGLTTGLALAAVAVPVTGAAAQISAGYAATCIGTDAGEAYCWGSNTYGNLGDGTTTDGATPTQVSGLSSCSADSDGDTATDCVDACPHDPTKTSGGLCGCGVAETDSDGDLAPDCLDGCPSDINKTAPGVCGCGVSNDDTDGDGTADCLDGCPTDPAKVAAGICGCTQPDLDTDEDGVADCNDACPLDEAQTVESDCGCFTSPELVLAPCDDGFCATATECDGKGVCGYYDQCFRTDGTAISAGYRHSCTALSNGEVWCWGGNDYGQLGDGTQLQSLVAQKVAGIDDAIQVSNHGSDTLGTTCALRRTGQVLCWGYGGLGQLGDDTVSAMSASPREVQGLTDAVQLSVGDSHACAVRKGGELVCWGHNSHGQLGNGNTAMQAVPVPVLGLSNVAQVSAGDLHTCALDEGNQVYCWGSRGDGRVGDGGATSGIETSPVAVTGIDAVQISAGFAHTCAVQTDGQAACWGSNKDGMLGDGTFTDRASPVPVSDLENVQQVSAGRKHTCAVHEATVACWGFRGKGRLGDGEPATGTRPTPGDVPGISGIKEVSAGFSATCAATSVGDVYCWGGNSEGMLGDGSTTDHARPVAVRGLPGLPPEFGAVAAGASDPWPMFGADASRRGGSGFLGSAESMVFETTLGAVVRSSPAIGDDGTAFIGSENGNLHAVLESGAPKWATPFSAGGAIRSSPAISTGLIAFFGADDGKVYAVDPDGTLRWSTATGGAVRSSPVLTGTLRVHVGSSSGKLFALNGDDGVVLWTFPSTGSVGAVDSSPAIGPDGVIYFGSDDDRLYAILPGVGLSDVDRELWHADLEGDIDSTPAISADGSVLYVGSDSGKLFMINATTGAVVNSVTLAPAAEINSSPSLDEQGNVYVGSDNGKLYSLNPDLTSRWEFATGAAIASRPAVAANGIVYVSSNDTKIYALDTSDGSAIWPAPVSTGAAIYSSPAISGRGDIHVGSDDGKLYRIGSAIEAPPTPGVDTVADEIARLRDERAPIAPPEPIVGGPFRGAGLMVARGVAGNVSQIAGAPYLINIDSVPLSAPALERANAFLSAWGGLWHLDTPGHTLVHAETTTDQNGADRVRFSQYYHGARVSGASVALRFNEAGHLLGAAARYVHDVTVDPVPTYGVSAFIDEWSDVLGTTFETPELIVFSPRLLGAVDDVPDQLAWRANFTAMSGGALHAYALTADAHTLELIELASTERAGFAFSLHEGSTGTDPLHDQDAIGVVKQDQGCDSIQKCAYFRDRVNDIATVWKLEYGRTSFGETVTVVYDDPGIDSCNAKTTGSGLVRIGPNLDTVVKPQIDVVAHEFGHQLFKYVGDYFRPLGTESPSFWCHVGEGLNVTRCPDVEFETISEHFGDYSDMVVEHILERYDLGATQDWVLEDFQEVDPDLRCSFRDYANPSPPDSWRWFQESNNLNSNSYDNLGMLNRLAFMLHQPEGTATFYRTGLPVHGLGYDTANTIYGEAFVLSPLPENASIQQLAFALAGACHARYGSSSLTCRKLFEGLEAVGLWLPIPLDKNVPIGNFDETPDVSAVAVESLGGSRTLLVFWPDATTGEVQWARIAEETGSVWGPFPLTYITAERCTATDGECAVARTIKTDAPVSVVNRGARTYLYYKRANSYDVDFVTIRESTEVPDYFELRVDRPWTLGKDVGTALGIAAGLKTDVGPAAAVYLTEGRQERKVVMTKVVGSPQTRVRDGMRQLTSPGLGTNTTPYLMTSRLGVDDEPGPDLLALVRGLEGEIEYAFYPAWQDPPGGWVHLCDSGVCAGWSDLDGATRQGGGEPAAGWTQFAETIGSDRRPTAVEHHAATALSGIGITDIGIMVVAKLDVGFGNQAHKVIARAPSAGPRVLGPTVLQGLQSGGGPAVVRYRRNRLDGPAGAKVNAVFVLHPGPVGSGLLQMHESTGTP